MSMDPRDGGKGESRDDTGHSHIMRPERAHVR